MVLRRCTLGSGPLAVLASAFALLGARSADAAALTFYASPDGTGTDCSSPAPCSLGAAQAKVRSVNAQMTDDVVVRLGPGVYLLEAPLTLGAEDSGNNGHRVTWEVDGCGPVLSGGLGITGWTVHDAGKNIWKASVPVGFDSRQLYVNDVRAVRARTPGDLSTTATSRGAMGSPGFSGMTQDGSNTTFPVATFHNIDRVEAIMRFNWWRMERCPLSGASGSWMTFRQPCGRMAYTSEQRQVYYVENAYELLDAEGEWYLDPTVSTVYYKPRSGEDLATVRVYAGRLEQVLHADGAHDLTLRGITFAHTTWMFPSGDDGYTGWQGGYYYSNDGNTYGNAMPAGVLFEHATNVTLEKSRVVHMGAAGVNVMNGSRGTQIVGNVIEDVAGHGVQVGHSDDSETSGVFDTTISNNEIRAAAVEFQDNHGVFVPLAHGVNVTHNRIHDFTYSAVALGWGWSPANGWWGALTVDDNEIFDVMKVGTDGGGIYAMSGQTGSELMRNYMHDYRDPGREHVSTGYMHGGHLYMEQGAGNYKVWNNVCTTTLRWLFTWNTDNHDDDIEYNWSDTSVSQDTIAGLNNNVIANNQVITNGAWPAEANAVMGSAGLEAAYKEILTASCPSTGIGGSSGAGGKSGAGGSIGEGDAGGEGGASGAGDGGPAGAPGVAGLIGAVGDADATSPAPDDSSSSGCGCRASGATSGVAAWLAFVLGGLALVLWRKS